MSPSCEDMQVQGVENDWIKSNNNNNNNNNNKARRADLLIIHKSGKNCQIIDMAIPEDGRVRAKEDEKVEKYQDLS